MNDAVVIDPVHSGVALLILDREKLVRGLVSSALDRGGDLLTGRAIPEVSGGKVCGVGVASEKIKADTYVDASGASAVLRRKFKSTPPDSFFTGYREIVEGELPDRACHVFQSDPSHALWAFPADGRTNIGGGLFREDGADLEDEVGRLKEDLGLEGEVLDSGFGPIPSAKPVDLVHENAVAIGDAGFTANPLTGGGIGPSIRAANLLADTLQDRWNLGEFQRRYMHEVADGYERNYYLSRALLKLQKLVPERVARWALEKVYGGRPAEG